MIEQPRFGNPCLVRGIALRRLCVALLLFTATLFGSEAGSRSSAGGPASKRSVSAGPFQVDAVTGQVEINLPVGPRLPGRIPLGIAWHYTSPTGTIDVSQATFKSFDWPADLWADKRVTLTLNHRQLRFLRPNGGLTQAQAQALLGALGSDGSTGLSQDVSNFWFGLDYARPSEDGSAWLIASRWHPRVTRDPGNRNPDDPQPDDPPAEGIQTVVVQGGLAYTLSGGNVTIRNQWGDRVQVTTSLDGYGRVASQTITNAMGQFVQYQLSGNAWTVTNNLGLAAVSGTLANDIPGRGALLGSISNGIQTASSFEWADSLRPSKFTASNGSTVTLNWGSTGFSAFPEAFSAGNSTNGQGADENGIPAGQWKGYEPVSTASNCYIGVPQSAVSSLSVSGGPGELGYTTEIARTYPKPSSYDSGSRSIVWNSFPYQVTIRTTTTDSKTQFSRLTLAQPSGGGEYGAPAWSGIAAQSGASQRQMLLFALGTVVNEEQGYGPAGSETITLKTSYEGWSLLNRLNPAGVVSGEVALQPVATRIRTECPRGDGPTVVRELTGWNEQTLTYANQREVTLPPNAGASTQGPAAPTWRNIDFGANDQVSGSVERNGATQVEWDALLLKMRPTQSSSSLSGSEYATLRGISTLELGSKTYTYDPQGRPTSVKGVTGSFEAITTSSYGNGPEVTEVTRTMTGTEPSGDAGEAYSWDGPFRTGARQKPDTRWSSETRDALGRLTRTTSPEGVVVHNNYDSLGRVSSTTRDAVTGAGSLTNETTPSPDGRTLVQTQSGSDIVTQTTRTKFDGAGRPIEVTVQPGTPAARTVFTQYDGFGRKVLESLPSRKSSYSPGDPAIKWFYGEDGFLLSVTNARGATTSYSRPTWDSWDSLDAIQGFKSTVTTPKGTTTTLKDLLGQVRRVKDASGVVTKMDYDAYGRLKTVNRAGQVRSYQYNEVGWLLSQTQPEEGTTTFSRHTLAGTPLTTTKGNTTTRITLNTNPVLADLPLLMSASGAGSATVSRAYDHDPANRRLRALSEAQSGGSLSESYGYDGLGRLISKTTSDGKQTFTVSRSLDAAGGVVELIYPSGPGQTQKVARYGVDATGRPLNVTFGDPGNPANVASYGYDAEGVDQDLLSYANGAATRFTRNGNQELSQVVHRQKGGAVSEDSILQWSADGFLTQRGDDTFAYDTLGRLSTSTVTGPDGTRVRQNFTYDDWGNRTSLSSIPEQGSLPKEAVGYTLNYQSDNRIPLKTTGEVPTGAEYDGLGRLARVFAIPGDDRSLTTWAYDALGRVAAQDGQDPAWKESYLLDGAGLRFKRRKGDGNVEYTVYGFGREPLSVFTQKQSQTLGTSDDFQNWARVIRGTGVAPVVTANNAVAPDGTMTADTVVFNVGSGTTESDWSFLFGPLATVRAGSINTTSLWVKGAVGQQILMRGVAFSAYILITCTGQWQQVCSPETAYDSDGYLSVGLRQGIFGTLNTIANVQLWRGQITEGNFPSGTQTNGLSPFPNAFENWAPVIRGTGIAPVVTANNAVAPDGTMTADTVVFNVGSGTTESDWSFLFGPHATVRAGSINTTSLWVKGAVGQQILMRGVAFSAYILITCTGQWQQVCSPETAYDSDGYLSVGLRQGIFGTLNTIANVQLWRGQITEGSNPIAAGQSTSALTWRRSMVYGFGQLLKEESPEGESYQQADQVGSPTVLTGSDGIKKGQQKSLPFGERMTGWGDKSFRRFTNHEDGPQFPIYMQARMYLPTYGRFAQPDPAYDHSEDGLNLYSYCSNNPVTRTDPDGMRDISGGGGGSGHDTHYLYELTPNALDHWVEGMYQEYSASISSNAFDLRFRDPSLVGYLLVKYVPETSTASQTGQGEDKSNNGSQSGAELTQLGKFSIFEFHKSDHGIVISLGYQDNGSGLTGFNWIQTVRTNDPKGDNKRNTYNDHDKGASGPFYYQAAELKLHTNVNGWNVTFRDTPTRPNPVKGTMTTWQGELSLVGKSSVTGRYSIVQTIRYGFCIDSRGNISVQTPRIVEPSNFQLGWLP